MACKPDAATIADPIREHKLQTTELASGTSYVCIRSAAVGRDGASTDAGEDRLTDAAELQHRH